MFNKFKVFYFLSCIFFQNYSHANPQDYTLPIKEDILVGADPYASVQTPRVNNDLEASTFTRESKFKQKCLRLKSMAQVVAISALTFGAITGTIFYFQSSPKEEVSAIQRNFLKIETRNILCDFREDACSSSCTVSCDHLPQESDRYSICMNRFQQDKARNCLDLCLEKKEQCLSSDLPKSESILPNVAYDRKKEVLKCVKDKNNCLQTCSSLCDAVLSYQGCNVTPGCHESCDATYIQCLVIEDNSPSERLGPVVR